jgi:hypothetical protein
MFCFGCEEYASLLTRLTQDQVCDYSAVDTNRFELFCRQNSLGQSLQATSIHLYYLNECQTSSVFVIAIALAKKQSFL